jgi:hypothetical protein
MYQNILNQGRDVRKFEYDFMKKLARKRNWLSSQLVRVKIGHCISLLGENIAQNFYRAD